LDIQYKSEIDLHNYELFVDLRNNRNA